MSELTIFDEFYRSECPHAVRLGWTLTGRKDLAEELAQEAFLAAHRRWAQVGTYERPGAWVRRVILNSAASRRRRLLTEAKHRIGVAHSDDIQAATSEALDLIRALRKLPRRQAQVLALVVADDMSINDIAETLELSEDTVRTHLRRGRQRLTELLADTSEGTVQ